MYKKNQTNSSIFLVVSEYRGALHSLIYSNTNSPERSPSDSLYISLHTELHTEYTMFSSLFKRVCVNLAFDTKFNRIQLSGHLGVLFNTLFLRFTVFTYVIVFNCNKLPRYFSFSLTLVQAVDQYEIGLYNIDKLYYIIHSVGFFLFKTRTFENSYTMDQL